MLQVAARAAGSVILSKGKSVKPKHYRVPVVTIPLVMAPVIIADTIQALITFLDFTGFMIPFVLGFSLLLYGVALMISLCTLIALEVNPVFGKNAAKKVGGLLFTFVIEMIPFIGAAPGMSYWIWRNISLSREEDREKAKRDATMNEAGRRLPMRVPRERATSAGRPRTAGSAQRLAGRTPLTHVATGVRRTRTRSDVARRGTRMAGRATTRAGTGMVRSGVALSGTGVGAVVGVPLAVAGGVTAATGVGIQATGAGIQAVQRTTRRVDNVRSRVGRDGDRRDAGGARIVNSRIDQQNAMQYWHTAPSGTKRAYATSRRG